MLEAKAQMNYHRQVTDLQGLPMTGETRNTQRQQRGSWETEQGEAVPLWGAPVPTLSTCFPTHGPSLTPFPPPESPSPQPAPFSLVAGLHL